MTGVVTLMNALLYEPSVLTLTYRFPHHFLVTSGGGDHRTRATMTMIGVDIDDGGGMTC